MPGCRYGVERVNLVLLFPSTLAQGGVFPLNMLHASEAADRLTSHVGLVREPRG